jgi:hypothetical protein
VYYFFLKEIPTTGYLEINILNVS